MNSRYIMKTTGRLTDGAAVTGDRFRITVLTDRLLRLEYSEDGYFEDRATQMVTNRQFCVPKFTVEDNESSLVLRTEYLMLCYDKGPFTANGMSITQLKNPYVNQAVYHYGDKCHNLHGTARTLDEADGAIELEDGILSFTGSCVIDDSRSLVLTEDGFVEPSHDGHSDIYYFGYGRSYKEAMNAFYELCGKTPMLPRYALGNWWSRYYAYSQEEYIRLMRRFEHEKLPFSVAVIDMDWHLVRLDEKYGNGWTGYTWNEELFPDHVKMLQELHDMGMHVTLNVHPADGVRGHEKPYRDMAGRLGIDADALPPIPFDMADRSFLEAYFECLHHPLEAEGVDFWWIDWQQGGVSRIPGLDPLWMLNHYHYLDHARKGGRPLIFSRYAGLGSHRYPVGFSGDSIISWESLDFQPYFTITAANAGYGWWSHDIGGHMRGCRDDELTARWVQFGVFSPIMRLHSSNSIFSGKEPWKYGACERASMNFFLRLRHRLIPYIYTMSRRYSLENIPLVEPLYYEYPLEQSAYSHKNEYFFGSGLLVSPITSKGSELLRAGCAPTWLPEGVWYDIFTGVRYSGGRCIRLYRPVSLMPVLAGAGSILPLGGEEDEMMGISNPDKLELCIFTGADGKFELYEDDGESLEMSGVTTLYELTWGAKDKSFVINPCRGNSSLIPGVRDYTLSFYGVNGNADVEVDGAASMFTEEFDSERNILRVRVKHVDVTSRLRVEIRDASECKNDIAGLAYRALCAAQIEYDLKDSLYTIMRKAANGGNVVYALADIDSTDAAEEIKSMLYEILLA